MKVGIGLPNAVRGVNRAGIVEWRSGHDLNRGRPLVRVHPDDDLAHLLLLPYLDVTDGPGGHRYFEPNTPLLSLPHPTAPSPNRPNESHATNAGSRCESDEPGT